MQFPNSVLSIKSLIILFLLISFSFVCCVSMVQSSIKEDGVQIPPDFGKKNVTILVIRKGKNSYDKYLKKNFEKNYFGKYIIIDSEDLEDKRYANTAEYAYIFDEDYHEDYIKDGKWVNGPNGGMTRKQDYGLKMYSMFHLEDRSTGKIYRTKHGTAEFSKWMRAYIRKLEAARQKFK